ncbi:MAG: hypothetical protein ACUVQ4_03385 [bacterium]
MKIIEITLPILGGRVLMLLDSVAMSLIRQYYDVISKKKDYGRNYIF